MARARVDQNAVHVEGLADFRKSLRAVDKAALKEVQAVTKHAAEIVAGQARVLAPRRSGALAGSIRAATSGNSGVVRSKLPYANVVQWGGTIRPRGAPIVFKRSDFIGRAIEAKSDEVVRDLERGFNELAARHGW